MNAIEIRGLSKNFGHKKAVNQLNMTVPVVAMVGRRVGGRRTGLTAALLLAINAKVLTQCALTFRTYGLLLLLASVCIYLYVRRMQSTPEELGWGICIAYGLSMLALGYTHYFGLLVAIAFFVVDLCLLARGHLTGARAKVLCSYGIALLGYLPWAIVAIRLLVHVAGPAGPAWMDGTIHWQKSTADTNVHGLVYWLSGECAEVSGLFHIAAIILVVTTAYQCFTHSFDWQRHLAMFSLLWAVLFAIGVVWFYSTFVNTDSALWVERYFIAILPCLIVVTAWGITKIFSWIPAPSSLRFIAAFACVALMLPTTVGTVNNDLAEGSSTRFYRDLTQYLEQREDIFSDKTLVLAIVNTSDRGRNLSAWKHYYFDRKDTRDVAVNILDGLDPSVVLNPYDLLQYDTVYVTRQHFDPELPDTYARVFKRYFERHETDNPGGGKTSCYTKRR